LVYNLCRNRSQVKGHGVTNTATYEHGASFAAVQGDMDPQSLKHFTQNVDIKVKKLTSEEIVFDLIGAEPPLANALRRIMISEVPTMAIEKVIMWQNTSIIPDENLAHRVGLIPLNADADLFELVGKDGDVKEDYSASNSLKFKLHKKCTKKDPSQPTKFNCTYAEEDLLFNHANIYSGDFEW
jgi:DNA-directed RNA polymerase I and III subunit RPAC1